MYGLATAAAGLLSYMAYRMIFKQRTPIYSSDEESEREEAKLVKKARNYQKRASGSTSLLVKTQRSSENQGNKENEVGRGR